MVRYASPRGRHQIVGYLVNGFLRHHRLGLGASDDLPRRHVPNPHERDYRCDTDEDAGEDRQGFDL